MRKLLPTVCALDCPDTCALQIAVEDGRVMQLQGDRSHPITRGFACAKTYRYPERQEHSDRLLSPLKRVGAKGEGKFAPVAWDEALDEIAARVRSLVERFGPQSILPYCYAGTMGQVEGNHPFAFFRALGALELDQTICATTGSAGWEANYGPHKIGPDPEDLIDARLIILWGIHVLRSNSHLTPILKEARKRGATILHIDPYRNETSRFADEHWQIRVGTDAALALCMGREILENNWVDHSFLEQYASGLQAYGEACRPWTLERTSQFCSVPQEAIQRVVRQFVEAKSSFIKVGYGMTRNEGGGNAVRAITLLPSLTNAWQHSGGGAMISTSGAFQLNMRHCKGEHLVDPERRRVNMNELATELTDPKRGVNGLFVFNSNPVAVAPDSSRVREGMKRSDLFCVVLEHFQTDTADYADYLLPATTFLEHPDLYTSYGHYHLQWAEPVVAPRGDARPNTWIFAQIARRLGLTEPCLYWTAHQVAEDMLNAPNPWLKGITFERLRIERSIKLNLPQPFRPYQSGSHFDDRKIRFAPPPSQVTFEEVPTKDYPFRMISPPGDFILNTTMGNLESIRKMAGGQPQVILHPSDAKELGILDRARIRIESRQGSIERQVIVSEDSLPRTVIALGQWWPKLSPDGKGLNDLTSERLTDLGGGSTFGNVTVRCVPLPQEKQPFP